MALIERVKRVLAARNSPQPRPLGPASPRDDELTAILRARFAAEAAPMDVPAETAEEEWLANVARLRDLAASEDPRDFLNWDVIRSTMFVAEEPYIATELAYLRDHDLWRARWEPAIQEWGAGNPQPFSKYPSSSGNLIHHAYHLARFEDSTGARVDELDLVVEFGGGYGSMRRLFDRLGFRGSYVIHDLPEFTCLQEYFLQLGGMKQGSTTFTTDLASLSKTVVANHSDRSLLVGTWSISEAPTGLREGLMPVADRMSAHLLGYQNEFSGVDNLGFFSQWESRFSDFDWHDLSIDHLPGNRYAFGIRTSTPRST